MHENVTLADETSRGLVRLMDGTRDRAKLAADLQEHVRRFSPPGTEAAPVEAAQLEAALRSFAKLGLLTS